MFCMDIPPFIGQHIVAQEIHSILNQEFVAAIARTGYV